MNAMTPPVEQSFECPSCIDSILCSLAFQYRDLADPLLDLKLDTDRRSNPGACVQTYFRLLDRLPSKARGDLYQLRIWLEGLIEVWAFSDHELLTRRSVDLNWGSMDQCITAIMRDFRRISAVIASELDLEFAFRNEGYDLPSNHKPTEKATS